MNDRQKLFLDVESSLSGRIWVKPDKEQQKLATGFQQVSSLPYPLALLLAQRELRVDQIDTFLGTKIRDTLPDPISIYDMEKGVDILSQATLCKSKIAIFADYDVDGGASLPYSIIGFFSLD